MSFFATLSDTPSKKKSQFFEDRFFPYRPRISLSTSNHVNECFLSTKSEKKHIMIVLHAEDKISCEHDLIILIPLLRLSGVLPSPFLPSAPLSSSAHVIATFDFWSNFRSEKEQTKSLINYSFEIDQSFIVYIFEIRGKQDYDFYLKSN